MVIDKKEDSPKTPGTQGSDEHTSEPNKIKASTPYDFSGKNPTPYGGRLPVRTQWLGLAVSAFDAATVPGGPQTAEPVPQAIISLYALLFVDRLPGLSDVGYFTRLCPGSHRQHYR